MIALLIGCHHTITETGTVNDGSNSVATGDTAAEGGPTGDTGCQPTTEILGDHVDQACNGPLDELGVGDAAEDAAVKILYGHPGEGAGRALDAAVDLDGVPALAVGGYNFAWLHHAPLDGVAELTARGKAAEDRVGFTVAVTDWDQPLATADNNVGISLFSGQGLQLEEEDDLAFPSVTGGWALEAADLDEDGQDELVTGGFGLATFEAPVDGVMAEPTFVLSPPDPPPGEFGYHVGEVGDLDGDGVPELTLYSEDDLVGGAVYVVPGGLTGTVSADDVGFGLVGEEPYGQAGYSIALGDVDGDGYLDVVAGAELAHERGGYAYVYPGPVLGLGELAAGRARVEPLYDGDQCGYAVETLPNPDGGEDVVIGCPSGSFPGRVEIYAGSTAEGTLDAHLADRVLVATGRFGSALTADADLTGDGWPDLAVGAPNDVTIGVSQGTESGGIPNGAVYVFASPVW